LLLCTDFGDNFVNYLKENGYKVLLFNPSLLTNFLPEIPIQLTLPVLGVTVTIDTTEIIKFTVETIIPILINL